MTENKVTLAGLATGGLHAVGEKVEQELRADDALHSEGIAWPLLRPEAASRLAEALDVDALEIIAAAWSKAQELRKYTDPEKYPPDQSVLVHLGEHEVTCRVHPEIDVSLGEVPLRRIKFTLELVARFKSAALTIRGGALRAVAPGSCSALVVLKYGNVKLKEERTPEVRFPGRLSLGAGLPIS